MFFPLHRVGVFCCSARLRADNHCAFTVSEPPAHFSNIVHRNRSAGLDSNFIYFSLVFIFLSYLTCSGHPANVLTFYTLSNLTPVCSGLAFLCSVFSISVSGAVSGSYWSGTVGSGVTFFF